MQSIVLVTPDNKLQPTSGPTSRKPKSIFYSSSCKAQPQDWPDRSIVLNLAHHVSCNKMSPIFCVGEAGSAWKSGKHSYRLNSKSLLGRVGPGDICLGRGVTFYPSKLFFSPLLLLLPCPSLAVQYQSQFYAPIREKSRKGQCHEKKERRRCCCIWSLSSS